MKVTTSVGAIELLDLPLACCGLESSAVSWQTTDEPAVAAVLCISGTISAKSLPSVKSAWEELKAKNSSLPIKVIAVGACASSGGPYWDYPGVVPANTVIPVDLMVPGCPPTPSAISQAVEQVVSA